MCMAWASPGAWPSSTCSHAPPAAERDGQARVLLQYQAVGVAHGSNEYIEDEACDLPLPSRPVPGGLLVLVLGTSSLHWYALQRARPPCNDRARAAAGRPRQHHGTPLRRASVWACVTMAP